MQPPTPSKFDPGGRRGREEGGQFPAATPLRARPSTPMSALLSESLAQGCLLEAGPGVKTPTTGLCDADGGRRKPEA